MPIYCFPAENGSNPTMAVAATAAGDQQLQQTANVSEKEKERETSIASNDIGNGSGKESPHLHEESALPERYLLFGSTEMQPIIAILTFLLRFSLIISFLQSPGFSGFILLWGLK